MIVAPPLRFAPPRMSLAFANAFYGGSGKNFTKTLSGIVNFSMMAWVFAPSAITTSYKSICISRTSGQLGLLASGGPGANNTLAYAWSNGNDEINAVTGLTFPAGEWFLAGLSVQPTTAVIYLVSRTGLASFSVSKTFTAQSPSAWTIGSQSFSSSLGWPGSIAMVAMWVATLPQAAFAQVYQGLHPGFVAPKPIFVWTPTDSKLFNLDQVSGVPVDFTAAAGLSSGSVSIDAFPQRVRAGRRRIFVPTTGSAPATQFPFRPRVWTDYRLRR